jgi:hypothetical protein
MGELVNLNRARKAKTRAEKEQVAAENRVRFGRTKAEKALKAKEAERQAKVVEGHKLEDEGEVED